MDNKKLRPASGRPAIELVLVREEGAEAWKLDSLAFNRKGCKVSIQPDRDEPPFLEKALTPEFVAAVAPYLPESGSTASVLSSSVWIELPDLVLGKMRVLFSKIAGRRERLMLRFQQAVGDLQAILLPHLRDHRTGAPTLEEMASKALLDLVHPCLDLAQVELTQVTRDRHQQVLERLCKLKENKVELDLFAHLLRRFIEHSSGLTPILSPARPNAQPELLASDGAALPPMAQVN